MKVLYLASEVAPFSKTGGLGDVAGALPAALAKEGCEVMVVTPRYASVKHREVRPQKGELRLSFPCGSYTVGRSVAQLGKGHRVVFLEQDALFGRAGLYQEGGADYADNAQRFGIFAVAALSTAQALGFEPDVVHLNDWQTGLAAPALRARYRETPLGKARSLFTIHNLAYQGVFPESSLEALGLPRTLFTPEGLEFYGQVNFLKAGLAFSDALSTVSPTYAREIQTEEGGHGLDGFLRSRAGVLRGILNGVDYSEWDPRHDPTLPARYSAKDLEGKRRCKQELLRRFGLPASAEGRPLFGVVSRLVDQKGIELLLQAMPRLVERGAVWAVLGAGAAQYEEGLRGVHALAPTQVGVKIGFHPELAHLVEAGSDFFVMPSRYEPCGLNQLYSLRYGTVPVVRATGGLDDTVTDLEEPNPTGIKFQEYAPWALVRALERALALYEAPKQLAAVRRRGMGCDHSWAVSARRHIELYRELVG